jgi:chitinase
MGYFYGNDRGDQVASIPADRLTHVIYAFIDVSAAGECAPITPATDAVNIPALNQLKQQHPNLQTLVSIGGYSHSAHFSDAALTSQSRSQFARSCIQWMQQNGFDGIDIDWETPVSGGMPGNTHRPEDKHNFTLLLSELRKQLDALGQSDGRHYLLTIAAPAGPSEYAHLELNAIHPYLDALNLETYAYYTAANPITELESPLHPPSNGPDQDAKKRLADNVDTAVRGYLNAGVPAGKLVVGVPFYGRGWTGVPDTNHGLYQPDGGAATDAHVPKGVWSDGAIAYGDLAKYYLGTATRYWDDQGQVPWLYDPTAQLFVTYEDPQSLGLKAGYVISNGLGGVMIWHLSDDDAQHTLVNALAAGLHS